MEIAHPIISAVCTKETSNDVMSRNIANTLNNIIYKLNIYIYHIYLNSKHSIYHLRTDKIFKLFLLLKDILRIIVNYNNFINMIIKYRNFKIYKKYN